VVGASKIVRDITGQRRAEERERRLLAEAAGASVIGRLLPVGVDRLGGRPFNSVGL
jgi:hypothetical protein